MLKKVNEFEFELSMEMLKINRFCDMKTDNKKIYFHVNDKIKKGFTLVKNTEFDKKKMNNLFKVLNQYATATTTYNAFIYNIFDYTIYITYNSIK